MKSISKILIVIVVLLSTQNTFAGIKNPKTVTAKISGSCQTAKTNIEEAGSLKKMAKVEWNETTQTATILFDYTKTTDSEILKRIALAGYDNEEYLAPARAYANLSNQCQYKRSLKPLSNEKTMEMDENMGMRDMDMNHTSMKKSESPTTQATHKTSENSTPFQSILNSYFALKNALVNSNPASASSEATAMTKNIKAVDMAELSGNKHTVWMKIAKDLTKNTEGISKTQNLDKQRKLFSELSEQVYQLAQVTDYQEAVYYQHCPMKDANWLSESKQIKNPYFGSKMMSCGSTVDTLNN